MSDQEPVPPVSDFDARLKSARNKREAAGGGRRGSRPPETGLGIGMRVAIDLVAGIAIGVVLGLLLDRALDTSPWLLIVFFVLGAAAGIRNVLRTANRIEADVRARRAADEAERRGIPPDDG